MVEVGKMTILDAFLQVITAIGGFLFSPLIVMIILFCLCVIGLWSLIFRLWKGTSEWILFWVIWPTVILFTVSFAIWAKAVGLDPISWGVN